MPNKPEHGSGGKRKIQQIDQSPDSKKLKQCLITSFLAASSSQSTAAGAKASQEKQSFSTKSDVLDAKNSPTRQATFANNKASPTGSDSVELVKKLNAKPPEWSAENTDLNQSAEDSNTIQFVTSFKPIITKPLQHAGEEAVIVEVVGGKTSSSPDVSQTQKHRSVKKKHLRVVESSDEDEEDEEESKAKKSLRCLAEDDEDAEYKPDAAKSSSSESEPEAAEVASEAESTASADENLADDDIIDDEEDADDKHKANQKRSRQAKPKASAKPSKAQQGTPNRSNKTAFSHAKFLATAAENEFATADDAAADSTTVHEHESYKFIKPESIRDKNLRRPEHPDYDPKTLFVDQEFLKNQTPAMKQWWQIKADNMDCILFFKMGKFYELWHQDADVGVKHLNLIHMRGEKAHAGFPEQAFSTKEQALVRAGFKVIRVEQTETPDELKQRQQDKKGGGDTSKQRKKPAPDELADPSKCVRRQICQISTPGTRMPSVLDYAVSSFTTEGYKKGAGLGTDGASEEASEITFPLTDDLLLVVLEQRSAAIPVASGGGMHHFMYGVTMFNSTRGQVIIGQFEDDKHRSRLRTLLAAHTPVEILYERNCLHADTLAVINAMLPSARVEALLSNRDVPSAETTLKLIHEKKYFEEAIEPPLSKHWPAELVACVDAEDRAARSPNRAKELCLRSFGAFVKYLDKCCVDRDILPLKNFSEYIPADVGRAAEQEKNNVAPVKQQQQMLRGKMVIDGITLRNLDILMNGSTGSAEKGSLLVQLDSCRTFFGRRKLREMLCAPPIDINIITQTQRDMQALERLQQARPESIREILDLLKKMPDIERLLVRVFQMGSKFRAFEHAEAQANFFDMDRYSKRKILDFIGTINGLEKCAQIVGILQKKHSSPTSSTNGQQFSSSFEQMLCFDELRAIEQELFEFKQSFNMKEALERGNIRPSKGADADYEDAVTHMSKLERKFNEYLAEQQKFFGTTEVSSMMLNYY